MVTLGCQNWEKLGDFGGALETGFNEFSACSDAEAVFRGVVGVLAMIVASRDMLLMIHMANDGHRDQNKRCPQESD
jgi:hypothetical protein